MKKPARGGLVWSGRLLQPAEAFDHEAGQAEGYGDDGTEDQSEISVGIALYVLY